jgi:hypothetical protein
MHRWNEVGEHTVVAPARVVIIIISAAMERSYLNIYFCFGQKTPVHLSANYGDNKSDDIRWNLQMQEYIKQKIYARTIQQFMI